MKKILIILLLFTAFNLYPVDTNITFGLQNNNLYFKDHSNLYISINIWQDIGDFRLYGNYKNEFYYGKKEFVPTQDYYTVGIQYDLDIAMVRLEHMCQHPVVTYYWWDGLQGGYTKLEVQL